MKKSILGMLSWILPLLLMAQNNASTQSILAKERRGVTESKGIKWITGLSWEQIKQKAKAENKYIFIDAYTTWCGPCKMMDENVYPNDTVGIFFNRHFIAVKVQMDVTDKDDQDIKNWYDDATTIKTECVVAAYPSLIFYSPQGKIIQKEEGYKPVETFVAIGKDALISGKTYEDKYPKYKGFVNDYKQGIKHYDLMPGMVRVAWQLNEGDFARQLFKDHIEHSSTLNKNERYTKENIELWSSYILKLDSKALQFFLKDYTIIDYVMGQKGWSANQVDKTIQGRIVDSFFKMQKGETRTRTGMMPNSEIMFSPLIQSTSGKIDPDYVEADWKTLKKMIRKHFSKDYAQRNTLIAKGRWYYYHENMTMVSKTYFNQLDKYPPADLGCQFETINQNAWETFLYVNDRKLLNKALEWMSKIIQHGADRANWLDTYANLLYKLGHIKEAINWEEKAISAQARQFGEKSENGFKPILEKMKKGEHTYLEQGAIWLK